ncbi:hypothetical protein SBI_06598 [Streptomyces bingchenggensis BCW-1]|uniref:Uncharacterized protein n=1 Tax=Streptomyces bingchenggensis (strain BCW-1) TaxID=749414 RepID=D7BVY9_STRBB|nr:MULTISPECIES: hypothetical protein [Streptomyces]ADI09718.1 hypothetical protein SBI_06598 [Streptomyces bingchenggensis BCW-1]
MTVLVLSGIVVLAVGGCVCVVWAARGGPRWVRTAATTTSADGESARRAGSKDRSPSRSSDDYLDLSSI